ncbi:alpha/beta hydrolase, partial [Salmonella enterica]|uniref:alpha/beta hydrolase n=1 Tax=Salmonella enterica TaxID=28901 RepID=UPI000CC8139C
LVHGYQSNEQETFTIGRQFYEEGYNVLTISLRAHGGSEGKYIGMGYLDKNDLLAWTHYLVNKYPESNIFYHGTSMGGATVLMAAGMELTNNVKAVVSDCAYTSIWEIFASE